MQCCHARCVHLTATDYIEDNCDGGRLDRYNEYCNVMLALDSYDNLNATCVDMGGRLMWFDTLRERNYLMDRASLYYNSESNLASGDFALPGWLLLEIHVAIMCTLCLSGVQQCIYLSRNMHVYVDSKHSRKRRYPSNIRTLMTSRIGYFLLQLGYLYMM